MHQSVEVYGTETCRDTISSRQHLDLLEVEYDYIDIARDAEAAQRVKAWNGGLQKTPTVVLQGMALPAWGLLIDASFINQPQPASNRRPCDYNSVTLPANASTFFVAH